MHLAVHWPRLGPYHIARLRAAHELFASRGAKVTALEVASQDGTYRWNAEEEHEAFARVCALPGRTYDAVPTAEMRAAVARTLDALDPDAVAITSYSTPDAQAALQWCRSRRRGAVLMFATKASDASRIRWREWVKRTLVGAYDAALVGGTPHRDYLEVLGFPSERIFQPYNAVDNAYFATGAAEARSDPAGTAARLGLESAQPYFLCVSRFLALKNLDGLIRAYARYASGAAEAAQQPWPLVLVGDGSQRAVLERQAAAVPHGTVHFAGFRQKEELPGFYGLAGVFVFPTFMDTWGLVVNEAMAASLPVLVSDRAGCYADLVEPGENGHHFSPDDSGELTRLLAWASEPELDRSAMGAFSAERIRAWSPEAFSEGLWQAYQAARPRAGRAFAPAPRLALALLRLLSRRHGAYHTVPNA